MSGIHPSRKSYVEDFESPTDRNDITCTSRVGIAPEKAFAILSQMDRKKRAAAILVPTDDGRVRMRLRELGEPITLFGEGPGDRRDRLRELLYQKEEGSSCINRDDFEMADEGLPRLVDEYGDDDEDEEFFTPGQPKLLDARKKIAIYSLCHAHNRIERQKIAATLPLQKHIKHRRVIKEYLDGYQVLGSQIAGDRPLSLARFSPDAKFIAAGSYSGTIRMLTVPNLELKKLLRGHTDRIGGISWHPHAITMSSMSANLASGGGEGNIHLWSLSAATPISTLSGHSARVCRVEHHPNGQYLASASFDTTWRLWDLATQQELLLQEGHSREVYTVAFQGDGALIASGGLDSIGRVWDLRTGRTIMVLNGHIREITGLAWHPDGYRV
ncbi:WD40 repeat-like protein, partial [Wilcoxina mikolae CBS 423.85]